MLSNATSTISPNATSYALTTDFPKAVVTIGILAGAVVVCLVVAKLVDYCYKRRDVRDDSSDISEHTKELLRNQLEIMRIGKKPNVVKDSGAEESDKRASEAINIWSNKVLGKAKKLEKTENSVDNEGFNSEDIRPPNDPETKEPDNVPKKPSNAAEASAAVAAALGDPSKSGKLQNLPKPGSVKSPARLPTAKPQAPVISKSNTKPALKSPVARVNAENIELNNKKKDVSTKSARSDSI